MATAMANERASAGRTAKANALGANDYSDLLQTPHSDAFAFSDIEQRALQLYDQLRELELEKSLIEAQVAQTDANVTDVSALSDDVLQEQLITAQREATDARTKCEIQKRLTHNVLVMDPFLKAVHGNQQHTEFAEKRMLSLISENDAVSMVHGTLASRLASATRALASAEQANIAANRENRELAARVLALAEQVKAQSIDDIQDPQLRNKIERAEKKVKESRVRMKILKGILSAMIVGSGINWAADEELRDLVMDDEEDG